MAHPRFSKKAFLAYIQNRIELRQNEAPTDEESAARRAGQLQALDWCKRLQIRITKERVIEAIHNRAGEAPFADGNGFAQVTGKGYVPNCNYGAFRELLDIAKDVAGDYIKA